MRVLLLTKDHPPLGDGAVSAVAASLAEAGHSVQVVTREHPAAPPDETREGVRVLRVGEYPPLVSELDGTAWLLQMNLAAFERAAEIATAGALDVVAAHGWEVAHAAVALRRSLGVALVAALGARVPDGLEGQIAWWLADEADRVIVPSAAARDALGERFALPPERVAVVAPRGTSLARRTVAVYTAAIADAPRRARWRDDPAALRALFERTP